MSRDFILDIKPLKEIKQYLKLELSYDSCIREVYDSVFKEIKNKVKQGVRVEQDEETRQDCNLDDSIALFTDNPPHKIREYDEWDLTDISINKLTRYVYYDLEARKLEKIAEGVIRYSGTPIKR